MAKRANISTYLSKNFTSSFLTIFLPLFFIGSLVFIIKISALTASIKVSFLELIQIFSYHLPEILFYIFPVSFLVATAMTLLRLSTDNELIALFSLGVNAHSIVKRLLFIGFLFSIILLMLSLALMPKARQQFKAFQYEKTAQAQVNINPSKLGQKFDNLFIYVKSKNGKTLRDVVIYQRDQKNKAQLFIAKKANFNTKKSLITLALNRGSGYTFSDNSIEEITYKTMKVYKNLSSKAFNYNTIVDYWRALSKSERKKRKILFFFFLSFIPLMGVYFIASFAIINPRYNRNYAYPVLAIVTIVPYAIATLLDKQGTPLITIAIIPTLMIIGYLLFRRNVLRYF